ncbi:MAG: ROK family protein [Brevinema sp.]
MLIGAIEAGGTKFIYGLAKEDGTIIERHSCPTEHPDITLEQVRRYFDDKKISALGVGSFGPIDLNPNSPTYGFITETPKPHWGHVDFLGKFKDLNIPIGFDTDVNGAALGEAKWGASQGLPNSIYITIGTGVGAGVIVNDELVHGILHPEFGHILLAKHPEDSFEGACPYHKACFEGLASGTAVHKRWNQKGIDLAPNHQAWEFEAFYLAQACMNLVLTISPNKIILGGGVMGQEFLFPIIRTKMVELLAGYIQAKEITDHIDDYIVPPKLGDNAGFMGAVALGLKALAEQK